MISLWTVSVLVLGPKYILVLVGHEQKALINVGLVSGAWRKQSRALTHAACNLVKDCALSCPVRVKIMSRFRLLNTACQPS